MPTEPKSKHIPRATIQRLATYVQVLENFARDGVEVISSNPLAEACGVNGSQVRKDLAYFGEFGIRGVGYHITSLIAAITSILNFAPARIKTPDHVHVEYVDFFHHLYALAFDHTSQHR